MSDEEIEDFFEEDEDCSPEENARLALQKEFGLPLLRKCKEIEEMVTAIAVATRPDDYDEDAAFEEREGGIDVFEDKELIKRIINEDGEVPFLGLSPKYIDVLVSQMEEYAIMLHAKTVSAMRAELYVLQMESAVLAKINARDLAGITVLFTIQRFGDKEHWHLLRVAIEEYRLLFRQWLKSLKPTSNSFYEGDGWGLFIADEDPIYDENQELESPLNPDEMTSFLNFFGNDFDDDDEDDEDDEEGEEWKKL